jgi:tetratricopeptide (TPR) repeat protein
VESLYEASVSRLRAGDAVAASALLRELLSRAPGRAAAVELLAVAEERRGDIQAALHIQQRAVALEPGRGGAHARLARLFAIAGDIEAALTRYESGARADRSAFVCFERAAILRIARSEAERAVQLLEGFLGLAAGGPEAAAEAARNGALPVHPRAIPYTRRDFAGPLAFEEAERQVEGRRIHEVAAGRYRAWGLLADAYASLHRTEEAAEARARALSELRGVPDFLLAEVHHLLGPAAEEVRAALRERG